MMMEFDNKVSWMDVVAIAGALLTGALVVFDVKEDVAVNTSKIVAVETTLGVEIRRVEEEAIRDRSEILDAIKGTREESIEGRRRIENKLDRLIERQLVE